MKSVSLKFFMLSLLWLAVLSTSPRFPIDQQAQASPGKAGRLVSFACKTKWNIE